MKKIVKIVAIMAVLSTVFVGCKKPTDDPADSQPKAPATETPATPETPETPAETGPVELEFDMPEWSGSIADDGTVTFTNAYGEIVVGEKIKTGDKITVTFAEVPSKVQLLWVEDPYETEMKSWGSEGYVDKYVHYSGEIKDTTFEYTFEKDCAVAKLQAMNTTEATAKLVKATLTKAE